MWFATRFLVAYSDLCIFCVLIQSVTHCSFILINPSHGWASAWFGALYSTLHDRRFIEAVRWERYQKHLKIRVRVKIDRRFLMLRLACELTYIKSLEITLSDNKHGITRLLKTLLRLSSCRNPKNKYLPLFLWDENKYQPTVPMFSTKFSANYK